MLGTAVLYTRAGCPFCRTARSKLRRHGIAFKEIKVPVGAPRPALPNGNRDYTFPQIFLAMGGTDNMKNWLPSLPRRTR